MAQINTDLEDIINARDNIKTALQNYGANPSDDIRTYGTEIGNLPIAKIYSDLASMEADQSSSEGTYGMVYGKKTKPVTSDLEFRNVMFPSTVTLSDAFSDNVSGSFRAVGEGYADMYISISGREAMIEIMGENNLSVNYISSDGLIYTREGDIETFDIGTNVKFSEYDDWDNLFGYFILVGGMAYYGLYQHNLYNDNNLIHLVPMSSITKEGTGTSAVFTWDGSFTNTVYDVSKMTALGTRLCATEYPTLNTDYHSLMFALDSNDNLIAFSIMGTAQKTDWNNGSIYLAYFTDIDKMGIYASANNTIDIPVMDIYDIGMSGNTYTYTYRETLTSTKGYGTYGRYFDITLNSLIVSVPVSDVNYGHNYQATNYLDHIQPNGGMGQYSFDFDEYTGLNIEYLKWQICPNQFTLNTANDLIEGNIALGATGEIEGTLGTSVSDKFDDSIADLYIKAQNYYDTLTPITLSDGDTYSNDNATIIPAKRDGTSLLDLSNMTDTSDVFKNKSNLVEIYNIDISNSTKGDNMFAYTTSLKYINGTLDTGNMTSMRNMFASSTIQFIDGSDEWLFDCASATDIYYMFGYCKTVKKVHFVNTLNVVEASQLFYACENLEEVSGLTVNSLTSMQNMFLGCGKLSDDSLNNILSICIGSSMTSNKTLKYIGLNSTQANKCKTLSNYSAFTAAGWTTGY